MKKARLVTQIVMGPVGDAIFPLNPLTSAPVPVTLNYQTSQIQYNVTLLHKHIAHCTNCTCNIKL